MLLGPPTQLAIKKKSGLTLACQLCLDFTGSHQICSTASIKSRIFRNCINNIQGYIAKVVNWPEPVSNNYGFPIFEPLHLQVGVSNGFEFGLKMSPLTFASIFKVAKFCQKIGLLCVYVLKWLYSQSFRLRIFVDLRCCN